MLLHLGSYKQTYYYLSISRKIKNFPNDVQKKNIIYYYTNSTVYF